MAYLKRDKNGRVINSTRNIANMNIFEYMYYFLARQLAEATVEASKEMVAPVLYFLYVILVVSTFPVSMPIIAWRTIRHNQLELDRLERKNIPKN